MNLKELARSRGTNLKQIAEKCNVPPSTLYAISRGDTNFDNIGISLFMKIADALGMQPEELYGREPEQVTKNGYENSEEYELLRIFRQMNAQGRERLLEQAAFLAERHPLNQASGMVS